MGVKTIVERKRKRQSRGFTLMIYIGCNYIEIRNENTIFPLDFFSIWEEVAVNLPANGQFLPAMIGGAEFWFAY